MSPRHCKPKLASERQLKAARALAGLTQKDLGRIVGVNERQIRFWEKRINAFEYLEEVCFCAFV
ncbi:MAG: XRE family transcriptional regulator [Methylocystaceae bacterium]|nr:XRE family transcriptional regulator [Methylocystaceae bacterium]